MELVTPSRTPAGLCRTADSWPENADLRNILDGDTVVVALRFVEWAEGWHYFDADFRTITPTCWRERIDPLDRRDVPFALEYADGRRFPFSLACVFIAPDSDQFRLKWSGNHLAPPTGFFTRLLKGLLEVRHDPGHDRSPMRWEAVRRRNVEKRLTGADRLGLLEVFLDFSSGYVRRADLAWADQLLMGYSAHADHQVAAMAIRSIAEIARQHGYVTEDAVAVIKRQIELRQEQPHFRTSAEKALRVIEKFAAPIAPQPKGRP